MFNARLFNAVANENLRRGLAVHAQSVTFFQCTASKDAPYFDATAASLLSSSFCPLVKGEYACMTMPMALHSATMATQLRQGDSSIWLTAGVIVA